MMNKLISVILPTYNRNDYLENSINSVLKQSYTNVEIIVIDDSSDNKAKAVVDKFIKENYDCNIKYFHSNRAGQGGARNLGLKNASGEIIAFLDDDDEWYRNKLQIEYDIMEKKSFNVAVYSGRKMIKGGQIIEEYIPLYKGKIAKELIKIFNFISFPALIFPQKILYEIGLLDVKIESHADWDFNIRLSQKIPLVPSKAITVIVNS